MGSFKIVAGDFGQGGTGQVIVGKMYRVSSQGLNMPRPGSSFQTEHIPTGQIEAIEVATEETLKKMSGSIGWGLAGALVAGPIGALAGVLAGGRKSEMTFICRLKDGRSFLGQSDAKTFTLLQAALFEVPTSSHTKPNPIVLAVIFALFIGFCAWMMHVVSGKPATPASATLNQPALDLATYLVREDMEALLVGDQKSPIWQSDEYLLGWLQLNWSLSAIIYEADYDANEISADNKFKGKKLLLSGSISSVAKDFTASSYITLRGTGLMGIHAELNQAGVISAAAFRKGQHVDLICTGSGQIAMVATANNCETLDDYITGLSPSLRDRVADFLKSGKPLGKASAAPIVGIYVVGLHLPATSPCLNGERNSCESELKEVMMTKSQSEAIRNQTKTMLASLKKN